MTPAHEITFLRLGRTLRVPDHHNSSVETRAGWIVELHLCNVKDVTEQDREPTNRAGPRVVNALSPVDGF